MFYLKENQNKKERLFLLQNYSIDGYYVSESLNTMYIEQYSDSMFLSYEIIRYI